jgi:hypothetical protein
MTRLRHKERHKGHSMLSTHQWQSVRCVGCQLLGLPQGEVRDMRRDSPRCTSQLQVFVSFRPRIPTPPNLLSATASFRHHDRVGRGWHPQTQKSIVWAPFAPFPRSVAGYGATLLPKPQWFVTNRLADKIGEALIDFEVKQTPLAAMKVALLAMQAYINQACHCSHGDRAIRH